MEFCSVGGSFQRFALLLSLFCASSFAEDPLIRFSFQQGQCINGTFSNQGSLSGFSLFRIASDTSFSLGNLGLESHASSSNPEPPERSHHVHGSMQPLLKFLKDKENTGGISIGLWIRSLQNDDDRQSPVPILTVGRASRAVPTNPDGITECDRRQIDLQLTLQSDRSLTLVFRTSDPFYEPCQRLRVANDDTLSLKRSGELTHVAIVLTQHRQQIYINGQPSSVMEEPFDPSLIHWSRDGFMQLFSYHDQASWHGRIYGLEVYQIPWNQTDVRKILLRGLPPALPYASATTFRIYEDAEMLPTSHSAEWYSNPNPFKDDKEEEVPELHLPIHFLDQDVHALLSSLGLNHTKAVPKVFTYISKLPSHGSLYQLDGSNHSASISYSALLPLPQPIIVFIPEHNTHSVLPGSTYTSIEYCVALREIIASTQCLSTATIDVVIKSVNDPPIAVIVSDTPYRVHEGIIEERIPLQLKGVDVDQGDFIKAFEILSPPRFGYLYLSVPVRREDGLSHGTLLSDLDFVIAGNETLVEYRYNDTNSLVRDLVVLDSFDFRVQDSFGAWSVPARVQIQVITALTGSFQPLSVLVPEDAVAFVPLEGIDQSGLNRSIGFFLQNLPEPEDAAIMGNDDYALHSGIFLESTQIPYPYEEVTGVRFTSTPRLCIAKKLVSTSIGYRIVAYEEGGRVSSVSDLIQQNITVACKVKPIELTLPYEIVTTHAFTSSMDNRCSGFMYNTSQTVNGTRCESAVILDGISVNSDSTHTERASVSISCNHGRLTLNQEHRSQLRLMGDQAVMRQFINFLALPSQLDEILAHLHFQSRVVGSDVIRISIQYGDCPETNKMRLDTSFRCFSVDKVILVDVRPAPHKEKEMLFKSFPWQPLPFTLTLILLMKFKGKLRLILAVKQSRTADQDTTTIVANTMSIRWKQFYHTNTGSFYYMNVEDGTVTWHPPPEDFVPCEEVEDSASCSRSR